MLVCHEYRFIYIKTHKTGSTSTEIALSRYCGPLDVIPQLDAEGESLRRAMGVTPQHHLAPPSAYGAKDMFNLFFRGGRKRLKRRFRPHMPACEIRPLVGERIWNSYFKFAFDRNPWDRQVSHYFYNTRKMSARPDFDTWIRSAPRARLGNFENYAIGGEVAVDFLGRFESLEQDIARALSQVGIEEDIQLPCAKTHIRSEPDHYRAYYTDETRELVRSWYAEEIEALGYTF